MPELRRRRRGRPIINPKPKSIVGAPGAGTGSGGGGVMTAATPNAFRSSAHRSEPYRVWETPL